MKAGGLPSQKIQDRLQGFTSDHAWQTAMLQDSGPTGTLVLSGFIWNLLNKGHEKGTGDYSNNPFDIEESPQNYVARKKEQFAELISVIRNFKPLDFMLLQEVNAFTTGELDGFPPKKGPPPLPAMPPIPGLRAAVDAFKQELTRLGWELALTDPRVTKSKPMVTLYNKNTLRLNGAPRGVIMGPKGKNTGFELPFIHLRTNKPVAITNLHLEFGVDSSEILLQYQFDQINKEVFTVMGGDTNHPPNHELEGQIGNFLYVTNIDMDPNDPTLVTDIDERTGGGKYKKHYDGFFCSPGGLRNRVTAQETIGRCFEVNQGQVTAVRIYNPKKEYPGYDLHQAPTEGVPWIRRRNVDRLLPYVSSPAIQAALEPFVAQGAAQAAAVSAAVPASKTPAAAAAPPAIKTAAAAASPVIKSTAQAATVPPLIVPTPPRVKPLAKPAAAPPVIIPPQAAAAPPGAKSHAQAAAAALTQQIQAQQAAAAAPAVKTPAQAAAAPPGVKSHAQAAAAALTQKIQAQQAAPSFPRKLYMPAQPSKGQTPAAAAASPPAPSKLPPKLPPRKK